MTKNRFKWSALTAAFVAASLAGSVALAADENESAAAGTCNNTISQAMPLDFDGSGTAVMNGSMINGSGYNKFCDLAQHEYRDIDFYSFKASAGEDFDFTISNAWNGSYTWTVLGVYGPLDSTNHYPLASSVYYVPGYESFIKGFKAKTAGTYYIGVSSYPGIFFYPDGGLYMYSVFSASPNKGVTDGTYTLTVKGDAPSVLTIGIDVKPGNDNVTVLDASGVEHPAAVRGVARGHLPVALLSSEKDNFYPVTDVKQSTLHFGATGKEESFVSCNGGHGTDVNDDGIPDLICHFDMKKANFALTESEGILTGKTEKGMEFQGTGWLKIVTIGLTPEKLGHGHKK